MDENENKVEGEEVVATVPEAETATDTVVAEVETTTDSEGEKEEGAE